MNGKRFKTTGATFLCFSVAFGAATPAFSLDVTFSTTLSTECTLALSTPGVLALAAGASSLESEASYGGTPAAVSVLSIGNNSVDVSAPTLSAPAGHDATGQVLEVSYSGASGLAAVSQAYTSSPTSFDIGTIPLSILTVNNRVENSNGFVAGTYQTTTVVTCGPTV